MWKHIPTNKEIKPGHYFYDENGRRHTAGWIDFPDAAKESFGIVELEVVQDQTPEFDPNAQKVVDGEETVDGVIHLTKTVVALSAEQITNKAEQKAGKVRGQRDEALRVGDWEIIRALEKGVPIRAELKTYRDALRDLPEHVDFPNVDLPVDPDAPAEEEVV